RDVENFQYGTWLCSAREEIHRNPNKQANGVEERIGENPGLSSLANKPVLLSKNHGVQLPETPPENSKQTAGESPASKAQKGNKEFEFETEKNQTENARYTDDPMEFQFEIQNRFSHPSVKLPISTQIHRDGKEKKVDQNYQAQFMEIDGQITRQLTWETGNSENSQTPPEMGPISKGSSLPEPYIYVHRKNLGEKSQQAQSTQPVLERTRDLGLQSPKEFAEQSSRKPLSKGSFMESQLQIHYENTKSERRVISLEANPNPETLAVTNPHQSAQNPTRDGRNPEIQSPRQNMETKKMEMDQNIPSPSICAHTKGDLPTPDWEKKSWKEEEEYGSIRPKLQNLPLRGHQNELLLLQPVENKNMEGLLPYTGTEKGNGLSPPLDFIQMELSGPNQFPSHAYPPNHSTEAEVKPSMRKRKAWARQIRQTPGTVQQTLLCLKRQLDEDIPLSTSNLAKKAKTQTNILPKDPLESH
ncbi:hypothetical protein U1Q18_004994, partial [Sarracenia purpurea var. burkii]